MMAADLPEEFDVIVLGTGLPETLLAAAFSRIGLSVLHLDRNSYYSGSWASFSLRSIPEWITQQQKADCYVSVVDKLSSLVREGEKALQLPETFVTVTETEARYHVRERPAEEASETSEPSTSSPTARTATEDSSLASRASACDREDEAQISHTQCSQPETVGEEEASLCDSASEVTGSIVPGQFDSIPEEGGSECTQVEAVLEGKKEESVNSGEEKKRREWFKEDVAKEWRKFSFDLAPKLLYCSGSMVELLIVSDVAKYCEFRTVSRVLTMRDNKLEKVPCSRADVFSSKALSLLEKRLLMKFLTFAAEYDTQPQEYQEYVGKPFVQFLASKKLSPKIQHFILNSIAMAAEATPTEQGLEGIQKFLRSLGRYGNTAFLFPLYGSGELPQGFCRLSAVFGGIYVLTLSVSHLLVDADNKCTGVITSAGQRIGCKYLIADPSYLPKDFYSVPEEKYISRGIFVTDGSIFPEEGEDLSLLQFPHEGQLSSPTTTVLELPPSAMVSPRPLYMVHMTRRTVSDVHSDLQPVVATLFEDDEAEAMSQQKPGTSQEGVLKPRVLWSLRFKQRDLSAVTIVELAPSNVFVVRGPGTELDTDHCVTEARTIFQKLCPEEEFLPKPPHPDDIIYVDTEEVSAAGNEKGEWATDSTGSAPSEDIAQSANSSDLPEESTQAGDGSEAGSQKEEQKKDGEKEREVSRDEARGEGEGGRREEMKADCGGDDKTGKEQAEDENNEGAEL